jgi:hypothetical protein
MCLAEAKAKPQPVYLSDFVGIFKGHEVCLDVSHVHRRIRTIEGKLYYNAGSDSAIGLKINWALMILRSL